MVRMRGDTAIAPHATLHAAVRYPACPVRSIFMYVYTVLELDHTVPFPPTSDVEHE